MRYINLRLTYLLEYLIYCRQKFRLRKRYTGTKSLVTHGAELFSAVVVLSGLRFERHFVLTLFGVTGIVELTNSGNIVVFHANWSSLQCKMCKYCQFVWTTYLVGY